MKTKFCVREDGATMDSLIVGKSPAIVALKDMIPRVAKSNASVMITGPSGCGKEMVSRAIHIESVRAAKPFVAVNCGAIPAELIESDLFGHERGSFTGAIARHIGRFESADRGTLFLDEIGDMRFDMQVKLLRVLEDGMVTRIGSNTQTAVDVRIISATHQDINVAISQNRFREDLYFRLGVIPILVPGLAARAEDIPLLIEHFKQTFLHSATIRFNQSGIDQLMAHTWPGNVRELRNLIERAGVLYHGEVLGNREVRQLLGFDSANVIPLRPVMSQTPPVLAPETARSVDPLSSLAPKHMPIDLKALLETMELERIQFALDCADGVISDAARMLTLKRTTLIEKMRKYGVERSF